jgi:EpsG family
MWPYYFVCAGAFCTASLTFVLEKGTRTALNRIYVPVLLLTLALFAGLRAPGVDLDYVNHLAWFDRIAAGGLTPASFIKDPGFVLICAVIAGMGLHFAAALLVLEGIALFGTWRVGQVAVDARWIAVFVYLAICRFFLPQEMTEVRAAVAIPLMSLGVLAGLRGKRWAAVGLYLCALSFHLSSLIALPVLILALFPVRIESRKWIFAMVALAAVLAVMLHRILMSLADFARTADYLNGTDTTTGIRLLSVYFLIRVGAVIVALSLPWKRLSAEEHFIVFCSTMGLVLQAMLSFNDTLALRGSEVFGLFDVLLFMMPFRHLRGYSTTCYLIFVLLIGIVFFHSGLRMVEPYRLAGGP